jgi:hypothetical protein
LSGIYLSGHSIGGFLFMSTNNAESNNDSLLLARTGLEASFAKRLARKPGREQLIGHCIGLSAASSDFVAAIFGASCCDVPAV